MGLAYKNHDKKPSEGLARGRAKKTGGSEERTGRIFCPGDFRGLDILVVIEPLYNTAQDMQRLHL